MIQDMDNFLNRILEEMNQWEYIKPEDIPNIDLYMDQVTTFMDRKLRNMARYPEDDKILTKTMINNYAKNDLLPPPVKKKYSKEHVLLLVFIYFYKGILSISDIQTLMEPITGHFFQNGKQFDLEKIYSEVFDVAHEQKELLMQDVRDKYARAMESFADAPEEDAEFVQMFSFVCQLGFDVYMKKLLIEKMIDRLAEIQQKGVKPGDAAKEAKPGNAPKEKKGQEK